MALVKSIDMGPYIGKRIRYDWFMDGREKIEAVLTGVRIVDDGGHQVDLFFGWEREPWFTTGATEERDVEVVSEPVVTTEYVEEDGVRYAVVDWNYNAEASEV